MIFNIISPCEKPHMPFGSGFFSNYRITLEQIIINHEKDVSKTPYVDWSETAWVEGYNPYLEVLIKNENPFDFWFDQKIPTHGDTINENINQGRFTIINHGQDYFNDDDMLSKQQNIDKLYLKPKQYIIDRVDKIYNEEIKDEIVLGVIARGSEFSHWHPQYGIFTIDDYINHIKKILKDNKEITKLFLVSENSEYINQLSKEFPNSFFIPNVFRGTDESLLHMTSYPLWPNISTKRENQNKMLGEEMIVQTKLLAKCKYLFGMHTGIFAGAILWNENIEKIFKI